MLKPSLRSANHQHISSISLLDDSQVKNLVIPARHRIKGFEVPRANGENRKWDLCRARPTDTFIVRHPQGVYYS